MWGDTRLDFYIRQIYKNIRYFWGLYRTLYGYKVLYRNIREDDKLGYRNFTQLNQNRSY